MKNILNLFIFLFLVQIARGQNTFIKAGVVFNNLRVNNSIYDNYTLSTSIPLVGIGFTKSVSSFLNLDAGIQYHFSAYKTSENNSTDIKINYLSLPIGVNFIPNETFSPGVGVQFAYAISSNTKLLDLDSKMDIAPYVKIEIKVLDKVKLVPGYTIGLIPITKLELTDQTGNYVENLTYKNSYGFIALKLEI